MSILINSLLKIVMLFLKLYPSINTAVSSANKIENNIGDAREKSFEYRTNNKGPKIEP